MTGRAKYIKKAKAKYESYNTADWTKFGFDKHSGGYIVIHKGHKFDPETGEYEIKTANILANNGYQIEMMDESSFDKPQYDVKVNDIPSEIKVISGYRNIHKRAEKAAIQGARRVIYYINFNNDREMFKRFDNVYKTVDNINEIWYIKGKRLHFYNQKTDNPLLRNRGLTGVQEGRTLSPTFEFRRKDKSYF